MPSIGLVIPEIRSKNSTILNEKQHFVMVKQMVMCKVLVSIGVCVVLLTCFVNTYHAEGMSRRQIKILHCFFLKISTLINFITIFGITMGNAFK